MDMVHLPADKGAGLKLRFSMTLFAEVALEIDVFQRVLDKFFNGEKDQNTLAMIGE